MMIGLFFFIRASVKDRTKQITLVPEESADISVEKLRSYFESRAYQLTSINAQDKEVAFKGYVQPSLFLAILLSLLATVGLSCLVLVLALLLPQSSVLLWLLLAIAPLAGVFYWRKAGRWEKILLKVTSSAEGTRTCYGYCP